MTTHNQCAFRDATKNGCLPDETNINVTSLKGHRNSFGLYIYKHYIPDGIVI